MNLRQVQNLQYAILDQVADGKEDFLGSDFGVSFEELDQIFKSLESLNLITGYDGGYDETIWVDISRLTEKGEIYLRENSTMGKALKVAKSVAEFVAYFKP